jgi:hypothetical protein
MRDLLIQLCGVALCLLALADLYVTVLYARSDWTLLSARVNTAVWQCMRAAAKRLSPSARDGLLTLAGPTLIALTPVVWAGLLLLGFSFIAWPALGEGIVKSSGQTPTDFATALYYSGYTLATLGYGDIVPQTGLHRVLAVVVALVGFSVLTLSLTYLMSVYSALVRRNTLALSLHHQSGGTDDAAELLARLGAGGDLSTASSQLSALLRYLHELHESHHSYPVLHYFRFRKRFYAMAHMIGMIADLASLAKSALEADRHGRFVQSAAVIEAAHGTQYMLAELSRLFLPQGYHPPTSEPTDEQRQAWERHLEKARERLQQTGLQVDSQDAAVATYIEFRRQWDPHVRAFERYMLTGQQGN